MTPLASVAMLEKLALLKIALCKAPVFSSTSGWGVRLRFARGGFSITGVIVLVSSGVGPRARRHRRTRTGPSRRMTANRGEDYRTNVLSQIARDDRSQIGGVERACRVRVSRF